MKKGGLFDGPFLSNNRITILLFFFLFLKSIICNALKSLVMPKRGGSPH